MLPLANIIRPGMRAVLYGRHSTGKQNMDTQCSMANEFVAKYDCTLVANYLDPAVSARKKSLDDRPGVSQLLKDAIDGQFDVVLMNHHDRMARNHMEHQKIRMILRGCNIPVVIISSESLYDSGDFMVDLIKDGTSKLEVENTRIRTRDTSRSILKKGKWTGGNAPFGYRYDKVTKTFSQDQDELIIVRRIYELYLNCDGFQSIASTISHEFSRSMNKSAVRWIITNPFYAGYMSHQRKSEQSRNSITPIDGWTMIKSDLIEPIMSLDEWKQSWAIYEQRKTGELHPKMYKTSFYLSNLLSCSVCNQKLTCKDQSTFDKKRGKLYGKKWYRCPSCQYKIESDRMHAVIDALLNDLKSQNLENVSSSVYDQMLNERQLIVKQLDKSKALLSELKKQLQLTELHAKKLAENVKDLETRDDNTKLVQVLTLQKGHLTSRIEAIGDKIKHLTSHLQYLDLIEANPTEITRNIKSINIMTNHDNAHDIRKMVTYLVQQAIFTPTTRDSKNVITKGEIAIQTRSSLVRTIIT